MCQKLTKRKIKQERNKHYSKEEHLYHILSLQHRNLRNIYHHLELEEIVLECIKEKDFNSTEDKRKKNLKLAGLRKAKLYLQQQQLIKASNEYTKPPQQQEQHTRTFAKKDMGYWLWIIMVITCWIFLWNVSSMARYYLKFSIFAVASIVFATTPIPLMLLKPKDSRNALMPAAGLRLAAKLMGVKCIVHGKENIVEDSGCVVVINHQSVIDLIVLAELWPIMDRCTVISKKEIFYIWPFGLAAWLWGTIFIDRLNAEKAQNAINSTGKIIRDRKARVLMFPEGTRSLKNKLLPFKKGAFHLAIASQCPIQPVVVNRYTFLGNSRFDDGVIHITILPQIRTEGLQREKITELIDTTYNVMSNYLENLSMNPNNNIDKHKCD